MTLTNYQLQLLNMLVDEHMDESRDNTFSIECEWCSNEEIDVLDELCKNPEERTALGDNRWIKVKYAVVDGLYKITCGEY
jgi:hypothetical protein